MEIEHDDIKLVLVEFSHRFLSIGRLIADFPVILRLQQRAQAAAHHRVVVYHQDASLLRTMLSGKSHTFLMRLKGGALGANSLSLGYLGVSAVNCSTD
jgi:hypothetical protein